MNRRSLYKYRVEKRWLTMPDGTRLAASLFVPRAKRAGETFPVLLEYLPYRKDDTFYLGDYPCFSRLAQLGFIAVKVDIRGTGASDGPYPDREYSDIELEDGEEVIRQLADMPNANGNVGMFGVSWSGFNSLQMAMRRPPALKAIHAVHASDDLYNDDVHYIDGNLHLDHYHLYINHELGLPRTPQYAVDEAYFAERFDKRPWLFDYLSNQRDGQFWRRKSLRQDYSRINIPVYLMGGLLDGYRSATVRMHEMLPGQSICDIGPWNHSCPDDGLPGPNYEWLVRMTDWFDQYLRPGLKKAAARQFPHKSMLVFVRHGQEPVRGMETTAGYWRKDTFPCQCTSTEMFDLASGGVQELAYKPFSGTAAGLWWGESTGDMAADDKDAVLWESTPVDKPLQIVGFPEVSLKVKSTSQKGKWSVRLEDVAPDGKVALITGALFNPALRENRRLKPEWPAAGEEYEVNARLHFTTWTFQPGHRIRLAVTNAQVAMTWPSPEHMTSTVDFTRSSLTLPAVPVDANPAPDSDLPKVQNKLWAKNGEGLDVLGKKPEAELYTRKNSGSGEETYTMKTRSAYRIGDRKYYTENMNSWSAHNEEPAKARYNGVATTSIVSRGRNLTLITRLKVQSDGENFYVSVTRILKRNGKVLRKKIFRETIARQFN